MEEKENYGLTDDEVLDRVKNGLVNGNFSVKTKSIKQIVLENVITLFNIINAFLAVCVILVHSYKNCLFLGVVLANVIIGIVQEVRAKIVIDRLSLLSSPKATLIRAGKEVTVEADEIVLDDIQVIGSGNQVCADAIILSGECQVNESALTGESVPIDKRPGDRILSGSFIVSGHITAKTEHVGIDNYVNKIVGGAKYIKKPNSQILRSIKAIVKFISIVLIPIGAMLFAKHLIIMELPLDRAVVKTVAAIIGMIPSGLVLLTSVVLAVSVVRLSKQKTLVQELFCIETLARVDVLCLDKTGTITEGTMEFKEFIPLNHAGELEIANALSEFTAAQEDVNATLAAIKQKYNRENEWKITQVLSFSSEKKYSAVSFENRGTYILGAANFVMKEVSEETLRIIDKFTEDGFRVLLLASSKEQIENSQIKGEITELALVIVSDKIREEAPETLEYFRRQGVNLKIISGDNPVAVSDIARRAGLLDYKKYIDASTLKTEEDIKKSVEKYSVFGRVTPEQKLAFVKYLKEAGHTVAMTGDGVNDVLALKEADCSIAMQSGSDAARNVSQLVLLDSNFASMPKIVAEGRRAINNIERSATLYLVKTIYASVLAVIFMFLNAQYPFSPIQLTLISSLGIGVPSFILALEPNHNRVKGSFLINVLRMAIPGGILIIFNIIIVNVISSITQASPEQYATMATYAAAFASLVVLIKVSKPMNRLRFIMCLILSGIFIAQVSLFSGLFNIVSLSKNMVIMLAVLLGCNYLIRKLLSNITDKIMGNMPNCYDLVVANPAGNRTIIVSNDVDTKDYSDVAKQLLDVKRLRGEQVGYIKKPIMGGDGRLEMMGGEFCGNAARSFGMYIAKQKRIRSGIVNVEITGSKDVLQVLVDQNLGTAYIEMPLPIRIDTMKYDDKEITIVVFEGIIHAIVNDKLPVRRYAKEIIEEINSKYDTDAVGVMFLKRKALEMVPVVYVNSTKTLVYENSCGSGTTAVIAYFSGEISNGEQSYNIKQPGGTIEGKVFKDNGRIRKIVIGGEVSISRKKKVTF